MNTTPPVISVTEELLAELEEAASKATPGPWSYDGSYVCPCRFEDGTTYVESWRSVADANRVEDTRYIARANPITVLALIARVRELEKDAARYRFISSSESRADVEPCVAKVTWSEHGEAEFEILCGVRADDYIDAAMPSPPKEGV